MSHDKATKKRKTELNGSDTEAGCGEMNEDMLKEILNTVKSNENHLNGLTIKIDNFEAKFNDLSIKYEGLEHKYTDLNEKYEDLVSENNDLYNKYKSINKSIDRINQQSLNSNIEIAGVPEVQSESPSDIAATIFKNLGFSEENIIKSAYRRNSKSTVAGLPKNIIVAISDKGQRDKILAKSRKIRNLNTSILDGNYNLACKETSDPQGSQSNHQQEQNTSSRPIYLNEHLTDFNKYLLARSKNLRRNGKFSMVYVRNGFVIVKIEANSPETRIESVGQLDDIVDDISNEHHTPS